MKYHIYMYLAVCEHSKYVQVSVGGKSLTIHSTANHPRNKSAMTQSIIQFLFICPIGPLHYILEMGVFFLQASVKDGYIDASSCCTNTKRMFFKIITKTKDSYWCVILYNMATTLHFYSYYSKQQRMRLNGQTVGGLTVYCIHVDAFTLTT